MASTSDSPLQMPAQKFTTDQKPHRQNNSTLENFADIISKGLIPIGGVIGYAGAAAPVGYLECDGTAINRRAYKELFSVIGTTYGSGDGSTTFNVPTFAQARTFFGGTAAAPSDGMLLIRTGVF